ncbi:MAG: hypothetical protein B6I36_01130 [Desulfobacteraceae bacterium 4572_35.1]|nr:MAG: hypothetical protein B6I36_01130 [Desulfobacteraceae bacterium 4572_35.1]
MAYGVEDALAGKRILVTRAAHQCASFVRLLHERGATTEAVPLLEIVPPSSWEPLDRALTNLAQYQYIILTSVNAVTAVHQRLQYLGRTDILTAASTQTKPKWVCVGPKTAQALQKLGPSNDLQPESYRAEAVVELLLKRHVAGNRILYPRAGLARDIIPTQLQAAGAIVDDPIAYDTLPAVAGKDRIVELVRRHQVDVITFTSSSSVENFIAALGPGAQHLVADTVLASIGPLTTATAQRLGLTVAVEAQEYTLEGLVTALVNYYN